MPGRRLELADLHDGDGPYEVEVLFTSDGRKMWVTIEGPSFGGTLLRVQGIKRLRVDGLEVPGLPTKFVYETGDKRIGPFDGPLPTSAAQDD